MTECRAPMAILCACVKASRGVSLRWERISYAWWGRGRAAAVCACVCVRGGGAGGGGKQRNRSAHGRPTWECACRCRTRPCPARGGRRSGPSRGCWAASCCVPRAQTGRWHTSRPGRRGPRATGADVSTAAREDGGARRAARGTHQSFLLEKNSSELASSNGSTEFRRWNSTPKGFLSAY